MAEEDEPGYTDQIMSIRKQFCEAIGAEPDLNTILGHGILTVQSPTNSGEPANLNLAGNCSYSNPQGVGIGATDPKQFAFEWHSDDRSVTDRSTFEDFGGNLQDLAAGLGATITPIDDVGREAVLIESEYGKQIATYDGYTDIEDTYFVSVTYIHVPGAEADEADVIEKMTAWARAALLVVRNLYAYSGQLARVCFKLRSQYDLFVYVATRECSR